jgi:hypothetical protein
MEKNEKITREELYGLVWSKPTMAAAKDLGLSDVGLAKICSSTHLRFLKHVSHLIEKLSATSPSVSQRIR